MQKPLAQEYAPSFQAYINLVPEGNFLDVLRQNSMDTIRFFETLPREKHDYQYATGKWTPKDILMHIIDVERVMCYRALVAARGDTTTVLYSMDENLYAENADVTHRTMDDLLAEYTAVSKATETLFDHVTDAQSVHMANGIQHPITARALGYIIVGHALHHIAVLRERYL